MGSDLTGPGHRGPPLLAMARSLDFFLRVIECHLEAIAFLSQIKKLTCREVV